MTSLEQEQEMGMGFSFRRNPFKKIRLKDVSIKNASKLYNEAQPLISTAVAFVPGGGVASKILDSKIGKFVSKAQNSGVGRFITKAANTKVGKFVVSNGSDFAKSAFNTAKNDAFGGGGNGGSDSAPGSDSEIQNQGTPGSPNDAQQETINRLKDDDTPKKNNTLLYAGIGIGVIALGAMAMNRNSN